MKVSELLNICDNIAPFSSAESWDNTGLIVGDESEKVNGILISLDCASETVDEAVQKGANVIISHHPVIFPSVNTVTEKFVGRVIRKLIKNDINLIVMHTNLDHQPDGVSHMIADKLGFLNTNILLPVSGEFKKIRINIPENDKEKLKSHLAENKVGSVGEYSNCFFEYPVAGQFKPNENANPHIGSADVFEEVEEYIVEGIFEEKHQHQVIQALIDIHPYEEPAYDILNLENQSKMGLGVTFDYDGSLESLVELIQTKAGTPVVNVVKGNKEKIQKAAVIGGSGMSYAEAAFNSGIDVLITGDVKYHEAYDAKLLNRNIIDAGHYIEVLMVEGLSRLLQDQTDVNIFETEVNTNPFQ
ncbi:Nif3-like dinuclear metal center hexameric protein [Corticicoccus populi]|uniref:GTP cyclohydrolase 1 type 2 homolog n=1 Tax=Corticicoccus populi TaxID=1812821 RepID=A0ABW5WVQ3_9STAP